MMLRSVAASVVLAVTTALAQGTSPVSAPVSNPLMSQRHALAGRRGLSSGNKTAGVQTPATLRQRVHEMEGTLASMHALLKQMHPKAAVNSKDPLAKANLQMWELMVGHLDKQLQELQIAAAAREDVEARRASMYKQADAKAAAVAQAARSSSASQALTPAPAPALQGAGENAAGQTTAGQSSPTPPATASPSPN